MTEWSQWLQMGGYAAYVWSSIAISLIVLLLNILLPWWRHRNALQAAREFHQQTPSEHRRNEHDPTT